MKTLILALLLTPSLLFSQESIPFPFPEDFTIQIEKFDGRCLSPVHWSVSLIIARNAGLSHMEVILQLEHNYQNGPLGAYHPETIMYMLDIVHVIFTTNSIQTEDEILAILRAVETLCLTFIESHPQSAPTKSPTKETFST